MKTKSYLQDLSYKIIGSAIEVHRFLGPGLLESVYALCFEEELRRNGLTFQTQVYTPINYKGSELGGTLKMDLLVENEIVVELKAVEAMIPLYDAQLLSYLKLSGKSKGLLINFNSVVIKDQIKSMVTEQFKELPD